MVRRMRIKYTDYFRNEASTKFGIRPAHVEGLVRQPEKTQNVILEGGQELKFYAKQITSIHIPFTLIAFGRLVNDELNVDMAFKLYDDLISNFNQTQPVQMLYELANVFGLEVTVGKLTTNFIFSQSIIIEEGAAANLVSIANPLDHSYAGSMLIKQSSEGEKIKVDCTLVFCIDTTEYLEYLNKH